MFDFGIEAENHSQLAVCHLRAEEPPRELTNHPILYDILPADITRIQLMEAVIESSITLTGIEEFALRQRMVQAQKVELQYRTSKHSDGQWSECKPTAAD